MPRGQGKIGVVSLRGILVAWFALLMVVGFAGCSINTMVANALTGESSSAVFTGDSDPELVGDALPFAIKMYEALLDSTPRHQGLMLTTGSLFVMYSNAFIHGPADRLPQSAWREREEAFDRAKRLYLRGHGILLNALNERHRGFSVAAESEGTMRTFVRRFTVRDVPFLYWTVASGLAAYSIDLGDFDLNRRIPVWHLMIERALELDPDFGGAALDEFLVLYFASLPDTLGGDKERARFHFQRAMEKTGGNSTAALISYARSICVPDDFETFESHLRRVLEINPDDNPSTRLVTILDQRTARWLLDNAYTLFSFLPFPEEYDW